MSAVVCMNGGGKDFVFFGDMVLTEEPVTDADLHPILAVANSPFRSEAWSCNVNWYFIADEKGISLLSVHSRRGYSCSKKSANFIRMFLGDAPGGIR